MSLMEWSDRLSVNIGAMDQQHRQLIDLINRMDEAVRISVRNPAVPEILAGLVQCANSHFETEEKLMRQTGFAGLERHHAIHQKLLRAVMNVTDKVKAGKVSASANLAAFLHFWLEKHIEEYDQQYAQHIENLKLVGAAK